MTHDKATVELVAQDLEDLLIGMGITLVKTKNPGVKKVIEQIGERLESMRKQALAALATPTDASLVEMDVVVDKIFQAAEVCECAVDGDGVPRSDMRLVVEHLRECVEALATHRAGNPWRDVVPTYGVPPFATIYRAMVEVIDAPTPKTPCDACSEPIRQGGVGCNSCTHDPNKT